VAFLSRVQGAEEVFDHLIGRAAGRYRDGSVRERAAVLEELVALVAECSDPLRRNVLMQSIAETLGVREDGLRARVAALGRRVRRSDGVAPAPTRLSIGDRVERDLVQALLARPELVERAREVVKPEALGDEVAREALAAVYRAAEGGGGSLSSVLVAAVDREGLAGVLVDLAEEKPEDFDFQGQFEVSLAVLLQRHRARRAAELDGLLRAARSAGDDSLVAAALKEKLELQREQEERRRELADGAYQEVS